MQVISLRESSKGPGGEYLLIEWRGIPEDEINNQKGMHTIIYYLSTKTFNCSKIKKEEVAKLYKFLRRKDDKVQLMQAAKYLL